MIVKVDGWIVKAPEGTAFVEFTSVEGARGAVAFYGADGARINRTDDMMLLPADTHWTERAAKALA